ncbi:MAG: DUF565 domain-containing protein [Oscillatoriales cyanobacterium SM2_1_8]|nr:DUF565 domain-containing protein [Oscillatoriales cyanobacterium SM2_1_8]
MQDTRLNGLWEAFVVLATAWLQNPWRRLSLQLLGFFFGFFTGGALSLWAGQSGTFDLWGAGALLLGGSPSADFITVPPAPPFWLGVIHWFKVGITYGLFVDAFKLGS